MVSLLRPWHKFKYYYLLVQLNVSFLVSVYFSSTSQMTVSTNCDWRLPLKLYYWNTVFSSIFNLLLNSRPAYTLPVPLTQRGRQSTKKIPCISSAVFEMRCDISEGEKEGKTTFCHHASRAQFGMHLSGKGSHTVSGSVLRDQKQLALSDISTRNSFTKAGSNPDIPYISVTSGKAKFSWLA